MSFTVGEWVEGRGTVEAASPDGKIVRTHTRMWKAHASAKTDTGMDLLAHASIPRMFAPHPDDFAASVRRREPRQAADNWAQWECVIEYSTETPDPSREIPDNPLAQPVKRSFNVEFASRIRIKDRDGNFILNRAGVPYNPPYEEDRVLGVHRFVRNEASLTQSRIDAYINRINSAAIGSRGVGTVRMTRFDGEEMFSNGIPYVEVHYEFIHDPLGWQPDLAETSFMQKNAAGKLVRIKDENGEDTAEPWPIDINGARIAAASLPAAAISRTWNTYLTADHTDHGLRFI